MKKKKKGKERTYDNTTVTKKKDKPSKVIKDTGKLEKILQNKSDIELNTLRNQLLTCLMYSNLNVIINE